MGMADFGRMIRVTDSHNGAKNEIRKIHVSILYDYCN